MYMSKMFIPTLRETPAEAEIKSHQLMLRAGLMRKIASGIYSYLPLGYKTLRKIEQIVREEMNKAGGQELLMPAIQPAELWRQTGRFNVYGPNMFKLKDRHEREFCLGPTHEEVFTDLVKNEVKSYKQLPYTLYQIQTKFRDERRPRFGLLRGREFLMKDAYSFDRDEDGLDISYKSMRNAYVRIFQRCGLDFKIISADSGAIGGSNSEEFMVKSEVGEDTIVFCNKCDYAANIEKAECIYCEESNGSALEKEKVHTPGLKTIEELTKNFRIDAKHFAKTILYRADNEIVAAMVRGDREVNEVKLLNLLGCIELEMTDSEDVKRVTGAEVGFAGPIGLNIKIVVDNEVAKMKNVILGANETDYHYKNVNINRDFKADIIADIRNIEKGECCPWCDGTVDFAEGIEVGHIFKLGTKYSKAINCAYIDENGEEKLMVMGTYGIGVSRVMAAIVEQFSDESGIIWPIAVAPYHVIVTPVMVKDETQFETAKKIFDDLVSHGVEVILDDRDERAGVKFKDADLIGIPIRIIVGKKAGEGIVEIKERRYKYTDEVKVNEVLTKVMSVLNSEKLL